MSNPTKIQKIQALLPEKNKQLYLKLINYAIYKKGIVDYEKITTIPKELGKLLKENLGDVLSLKKVFEAEGGQAHKVLFETRDGHRIEAVRMLFKGEHESLCISSQSGCALACRFCATGAIGFKKNLTAEEISDQVLYFKSLGFEVDSISFMGMGEPLANFENVFSALRIITGDMGIGERHINVSTVGIIPSIKRLTEEFPQINLAYSLHNAFPEERLQLMPITKAYPMDKVFEVLDVRIQKTNRRIFLAYILLGGLNDTEKHARELVDIIKKRGKHSYLYHVNLIRFNPGPTTTNFQKSKEEDVNRFKKIIDVSRVSYSMRQSFGLDIYAACGQLYAGYKLSPKL